MIFEVRAINNGPKSYVYARVSYTDSHIKTTHVIFAFVLSPIKNVDEREVAGITALTFRRRHYFLNFCTPVYKM